MWQPDSVQSLPGIFEETLFSGKRRFVSRSVYIKAMHPKTEISPTRAAVEKILKAGWVGQTKIHGHRAQIHLPHLGSNDEPVVYTRQGKPHKMLLSKEIVSELQRIFKPESGWTIIDAEWIKPDSKLYIFDVLKLNNQNLRSLTYPERWKLLPKLFLSPHVQTLPLFSTVDDCMEILANPAEHIEGLVFKSTQSKGFEDTSIIRCRKRTNAQSS